MNPFTAVWSINPTKFQKENTVMCSYNDIEHLDARGVDFSKELKMWNTNGLGDICALDGCANDSFGMLFCDAHILCTCGRVQAHDGPCSTTECDCWVGGTIPGTVGAPAHCPVHGQQGISPFVRRNLDLAQYAQPRGSQYEG